MLLSSKAQKDTSLRKPGPFGQEVPIPWALLTAQNQVSLSSLHSPDVMVLGARGTEASTWGMHTQMLRRHMEKVPA